MSEPWVESTLSAVEFIRTSKGSLYKSFKESFPDFQTTANSDYISWVWDWLIMYTPYEESFPGSDILVWCDEDSDFPDTEEKFTHRGHNDWN